VIARLHGAPPRLRMPGPARRELPPFQVQVFVGVIWPALKLR